MIVCTSVWSARSYNDMRDRTLEWLQCTTARLNSFIQQNLRFIVPSDEIFDEIFFPPIKIPWISGVFQSHLVFCRPWMTAGRFSASSRRVTRTKKIRDRNRERKSACSSNNWTISKRWGFHTSSEMIGDARVRGRPFRIIALVGYMCCQCRLFVQMSFRLILPGSVFASSSASGASTNDP